MTIQEAVDVLNERRHGGKSDWEVMGVYAASRTDPWNCLMNQFEAIDAAERYLRNEMVHHTELRVDLTAYDPRHFAVLKGL